MRKPACGRHPGVACRANNEGGIANARSVLEPTAGASPAPALLGLWRGRGVSDVAGRLRTMACCEARCEPCCGQRLSESLTRSTGPTCTLAPHCHHIFPRSRPRVGRRAAAGEHTPIRWVLVCWPLAGPGHPPLAVVGTCSIWPIILHASACGISDGLDSRPRPRHRVCVISRAASGPGAKDRPYKETTTSDCRHHG